MVWMHAIETDARPMDGPSKDSLLSGLMRPYETTRTANDDMNAYSNRHAKTKIRHGLSIITILLWNEPLLIDLLTLDNITADVLVSPPRHHLKPHSLRYLVERAALQPDDHRAYHPPAATIAETTVAVVR